MPISQPPWERWYTVRGEAPASTRRATAVNASPLCASRCRKKPVSVARPKAEPHKPHFTALASKTPAWKGNGEAKDGWQEF